VRWCSPDSMGSAFHSGQRLGTEGEGSSNHRGDQGKSRHHANLGRARWMTRSDRRSERLATIYDWLPGAKAVSSEDRASMWPRPSSSRLGLAPIVTVLLLRHRRRYRSAYNPIGGPPRGSPARRGLDGAAT